MSDFNNSSIHDRIGSGLKQSPLYGPESEHDLETLIARAVVTELREFHCLLSSSHYNKPPKTPCCVIFEICLLLVTEQ